MYGGDVRKHAVGDVAERGGADVAEFVAEIRAVAVVGIYRVENCVRHIFAAPEWAVAPFHIGGFAAAREHPARFKIE